MDIEGEAGLPTDEREQRRRDRAARIALQKLTGRKEKTQDGKKDTGNKEGLDAENPINLGGDSERTETNEDDGKPPASARGRTRSKSATRSRSASKSSRSRSLPPKKAPQPRTQERSSSVDSAFSTRSGSRKSKAPKKKAASKRTQEESDSSSDSQSGEKRKRTQNPTKTPQAGRAKFQDGIPNNEGKTASTKKHAKAKKAGTSYADKAKASAKKEWGYSTVVNWYTRLGPVSSTKQEVYSRLGKALAVLLNYDPECAFGCVVNAKAPPLRSAAELKFKFHGDFKRYFTVHDETIWQWDDNIQKDRPRSFAGSLILLSDKLPADIFEFCGVDLRCEMKGSMEPKKIQDVKTETKLVLFGVHANAHAASVAADLQKHLKRAELDLLDNKQLYEKEQIIPYEKAYEEANEDWRVLPFPEIVGSRSYPKGCGYEETIPGVDTSWKLAIHFTSATEARYRLMLVLDYFISHGFAARLFGNQASIEHLAERGDTGRKDELLKILPDHQNTNRSVGNITLTGAIDIDVEVSIFTEQDTGKTRYPKTLSLRDILRKLYVKIEGRKYPVFTYCFKNYSGKYVLWFWDTVYAMREFVEMFRQNAAAYIWHRCKDWGWDMSTVRRLFRYSFDSVTAVNAMNSKWNKKKQRAVSVTAGSDAATRLSLGASPFILRTGEDKETRIKPPRVQRGNLAPDTGGADIDDMQSVGDQSDTETVHYEEYDDEDDDVSMMADDAGFEEEEEAGGDSDDEETKAGDSSEEEDDDSEEENVDWNEEETKDGDDEMEVEEEDVNVNDDANDDSTFATEASDGNHRKPPDKATSPSAESGSSSRDEEIERLKAEKEELISVFQKQMEEMRAQFQAQLDTVRSPEGQTQGSATSPACFNAEFTEQNRPAASSMSPRPGADVGDDQGNVNSSGEAEVGASAVIK